MERQKFSIDLREDIESGRLKVETRSGDKVKIYSWDSENKEYPIIASVGGIAHNYSKSGEIYQNIVEGNYLNLDLYVVPLPHITDFEKAVMDVIGHAMGKDYDYPVGDDKFDESWYSDIREVAAQLQEKAIIDFIEMTPTYSNTPLIKKNSQDGSEYVHYMNFRFYPTVFQKLEWVKKKYFPGLLEEDNKNG